MLFRSWTDVYALAGALFFVVTRQSPPDAITRMKDDTVGQVLMQARMRYSAPFIDAIAWGLTVDDSKRARSVAEPRDALFSKKGGAERPAARSADNTTTRTRPVDATSRTRPVDAATVRAQPVDADVTARISPDAATQRVGTVGATVQARSVEARAAAMAEAAMQRPVEEKSGSMITRLLGYGFALVLLLFSGLLLLGGEKKPVEVPKPAAPVAAPAPALITPAEATAAINDTSPPGAAAPGAPSPGGIPDISQGMSREQFVQTYPHLANRFDVIDANRDGRISVSELVDGMQQFGVK